MKHDYLLMSEGCSKKLTRDCLPYSIRLSQFLKGILSLLVIAILASCQSSPSDQESITSGQFVKVHGVDLIQPNGDKLFIKGTNLGNWLNPEGYMFDFKRTNAPHRIDQMLNEMVGPDFTKYFWQEFKDNYITFDDIEFIASTGANTIRLPFHYKLFTNESYMGLNDKNEGFARIDSVVDWCRKTGLYIILDMHDAPGGQTGDNIDDSYGYPWLFESESSRQLFFDVWRKIAAYYKDEPVIIAYDLINEPIAPYFDNMDELNSMLEPLYIEATAVIREVDQNHIIMLGAPQWNSNFKPFSDSTFDENIMYSYHRYGGDPTKEAIQSFIDFRDKVNLPMYMGEIGHNTDEWMNAFCKIMEENNIGYTFWPYKKVNGSCFMGITPPEDWSLVVDFAESPRLTFEDIREARPDQKISRQILRTFIENSKFENCQIQQGYIDALRLADNQ